MLVVGDEYDLASDTNAALRGAGAKVLGPCPREDGGPKFTLAWELRSRGVPFVFLTDYDPEVIPAELADVVRLQKPLPFRGIVEAVSSL